MPPAVPPPCREFSQTCFASLRNYIAMFHLPSFLAPTLELQTIFLLTIAHIENNVKFFLVYSFLNIFLCDSGRYFYVAYSTTNIYVRIISSFTQRIQFIKWFMQDITHPYMYLFIFRPCDALSSLVPFSNPWVAIHISFDNSTHWEKRSVFCFHRIFR